MPVQIKDKDQEQKSPAKRFLFILGLAFFTFYFALGLFIIFWKNIPFDMSPTLRIGFGIALIIYSFFRFVRLVKSQD